jgi:hypothetical protein
MENRDVKLSISEQKDIAIEASLQLIPYVGGTISSLYYGNKQAKEFKRLEIFYKELSLDLEGLKDKIIPIEKQYNDGLISIIEQTNNKVEKEHQEYKINCYRKYIKNILTNTINESNYDKNKIFLDILESMSCLEIEVLSLLYKSKRNTQVKLISKPGVDKNTFISVVWKLKSYGFIDSRQYDIGPNGQENLLNEYILINEYGIEFIKFILE